MRLANSYISSLIRIITALCASLCIQAHASDPAHINQTKNKLKQLDITINHLKEHLSSAHGKRSVLNKELARIDTQIGHSVQKLRDIEHKRKNKEVDIAALQNKVNDLNRQLVNQQELLGNHLRARYQVGEFQPLKWLLSQQDPYHINRLLTYYQYIIKSRQTLIEQINLTRNELNTHQGQLKKELVQIHEIEVELTTQQKRLTKNKAYQTALAHTLNNEIQNEQSTLKEFQKNKDNLAKILVTLSQQSVIQASKPFLQMHRKLPFPVHVARSALRKMNQGVTFFADEGATVAAVHPGKVVFSDWLKGYGLLLIIDHGQGFMTLYAHNQSLFKRKGEQVNQNEPIASVGHSGGIKQNGLYFEIRQRGKAVSPTEWLS